VCRLNAVNSCYRFYIVSSVLAIILLLCCQGAYGTAVLYKKKDDDSLVILKEINLHELNVSERQLAQNEVILHCRLI